ncbi:ammonium transporter, partial [Lobulomyces angularis]
VSQNTGKIIAANNWLTRDSFQAPKKLSKRETNYKYNVVGFPKADLTEKRNILINPADKTASPLGWHNVGNGDVGTTIGNNVKAQEFQNQNSPKRPTSNTFNFDYPVNEASEPKTYWEAATVNTFYVTNVVHDIAYKYGFDEKSGNFQTNNFNKGGKANDAIIANVQSSVLVNGQNTDNANFGTPPDGYEGEMNMYWFTTTTPKRDGDFDNNVIAHELMHGITNRLTGGPANSNCLDTDEAGGMGEGWSDVNAFVLTTKATDTRLTDRTTGSYVVNNAAGIRSYPYSTNTQTNPYTYKDVKALDEVHATGEIWATFLFEVYWNMIDKSGFSNNLLDNASGKGNTDFYQILINGLKLQPCNPTFLSARNAIVLADKNLGSKYECEIWKGFAKRGMGTGATSSFVNNHEVPAACSSTPPSTTTTKTTTTTTTKVTTTTTKTSTSTATTSPTTAACSHNKCVAGISLKANCDSCVKKICDQDSFCCSSSGSWDTLCIKAVKSVCKLTC